MRATAASLFLALAVVLPASADGPANPQFKIEGATKYKQFQLVRLEVVGIAKDDAVFWRVTPENKIDQADTPRGKLQFAAPPGRYEVKAFIVRGQGEAAKLEEVRTTVEIDFRN